MKALSLFSGIGGLDLAAEAAGIETAAFCEKDPFCRRVLAKRWADIPIHDDVFTLRGEDIAGTIDVIHGGFPCQPFSVAGRQRGRDDERYLWSEFSRLVGELEPLWVVAENVPGIFTDDVAGDVCTDLERLGYSVGIWSYEAAAVGAPHRRMRVFFVGIRKDMSDACEERQQRGCEPGIYGEAPKGPTDEQFAGRGLGAMWSTPTACGNNNRAGAGPHSGDGLATQVKREEASGGALNPAWVEQLMGFPEGWTAPDVDEPRAWLGWPAPMGMGMWGTPNAAPCGMTAKTSGRPIEKSTHLETQVYCAETEPYGAPRAQAGQYPYEFPRTVKGGRHRIERLKALGNAIVPQQAYPIFRAIAEMDGLERSSVNA